MDLSVDVERTVMSVLASEVLKALDDNTRNEILRKSIESSLESYSYRHAIEKAVADRAEEMVKEMLLEPEWTNLIKAAVITCVQDLIEKLPKALEKAIVEGVLGNDDTHRRGPGALLRHMGAKKGS